MKTKITDYATYSTKHLRQNNQDGVICINIDDKPACERNLSLCIVFDGVSGSNGLEARKIAGKAVFAPIADLVFRLPELQELPQEQQAVVLLDALRQIIMSVNEALSFIPDHATTVSISAIYDGWCYTANVGDSPIFLITQEMVETENEEGHPVRKTVAHATPLFICHNRAGQHLRTGILETEEEALSSRDRNELLRCANGSLNCSEIATNSIKLPPKSILLIGSDGALAVMTSQEYADLTLECTSMQELIDLVYDAVKESTSRDNFTMAAINTEITAY